MRDRPRVLWLCVEPTPYMADEFEELGRELEFELEPVFLASAHTQPWSCRFGRVLSDRPDELVGVPRFLAFLLGECLEPPDAVVLQGYGLPHFVLASWLLSSIGVPWVLRGDTPWPGEDARPFWRTALLSWIVRHASWLLPGGTRQRENYLRSGSDPGRTEIGYMTVRSERFATSERGVCHQAGLRVVCVGRLVARKRFDAAIDAVRRLSAVGIDLSLEIVGEGPLLADLQERASGCRDRIRFAGWADQQGVAEAFRRADVFLHLAEDEPWGLVVNEAVAAGLPIVINERVGCMPDLLEPGANGFAVDVRRPAMIDAALRTLAGSAELRQQMGAGSVAVSERWTSRNRTNAVRRALKEVTAGQDGRGC